MIYKYQQARNLILFLLFVAILSLLSVACVFTQDKKSANKSSQSGQQITGQTVAMTRTAVTLGQDDVFEIRVFQEKDLTNIYRVSNAGTINFPLIGTVYVNGKTPSEVENEIKQRLEKDFLKKAYVSVFVKEFNSKKIFVFGQVQKPGTFRFEENMSIIQAITLTGGFGKSAAKNSVSITRIVDGNEKRIVVEVEKIWKGSSPNFILKPGDIIFVPERLF